MAKTLKQKIAARKKEMEDKEINFKTVVIARNLGHGFNGSKGGGTEETYTFDDERFHVEDHCFETSDREWGGFHREVRYNGRRVFYISGGDDGAFIPGEWEKKFNELYIRAKRKERQLKREEEAKHKFVQWAKELKERKKWGL